MLDQVCRLCNTYHSCTIIEAAGAMCCRLMRWLLLHISMSSCRLQAARLQVSTTRERHPLPGHRAALLLACRGARVCCQPTAQPGACTPADGAAGRKRWHATARSQYISGGAGRSGAHQQRSWAAAVPGSSRAADSLGRRGAAAAPGSRSCLGSHPHRPASRRGEAVGQLGSWVGSWAVGVMDRV
jgi:hypothetical protein